jgi:hypothetical protein
MNKVLTGCGVVGGLALLAIGIVLGLLVPDIGDAQARFDVVREQLVALEAEHPHDDTSFSAESFARSMSARAALAPTLDAWSANLHDEAADHPDGAWSGIRRGVETAPAVYEALAAVCQENGLGARQFSAHGRLLWAALAALAVSPEPDTDDLRTPQPALREALASMHQRDGSVPLFDELVRDPLRGEDDERDTESREPDATQAISAQAWILEHPDALIPAAEVAALRLELLLPEPAS